MIFIIRIVIVIIIIIIISTTWPCFRALASACVFAARAVPPPRPWQIGFVSGRPLGLLEGGWPRFGSPDHIIYCGPCRTFPRALGHLALFLGALWGACGGRLASAWPPRPYHPLRPGPPLPRALGYLTLFLGALWGLVECGWPRLGSHPKVAGGHCKQAPHPQCTTRGPWHNVSASNCAQGRGKQTCGHGRRTDSRTRSRDTLCRTEGSGKRVLTYLFIH